MGRSGDIENRCRELLLMLVRTLLPPEVEVEEMDPRDGERSMLWPEEEQHLKRAVDKRVREFAAGRHLARKLMVRLGQPPMPVEPNPDRSPRWPSGVVGTITHTHNWVAVAMTTPDRFVALGADVEQASPLSEPLIDRICLPDEVDRLRALGDVAAWAKLVFSAKEAAYKAQYALSQTFLGFDAMSVEIDAAQGRFTAVFTVDAPPFAAGHVLRGRFRRDQGLIATALAIRDRPDLAPDQENASNHE